MLKTHPILVYGPSGMLGQMVVSYFSNKGYKVIPKHDRFTKENKLTCFDSLKEYPGAIIINCAARIPQKSPSFDELVWVNLIFPLALAEKMLPDQFLIHPSTEGVFRVNENKAYTHDDMPDPIHDYGWSKWMGEAVLNSRKNTVIIRATFIGPDHSQSPKGLLGWLLSNPEGSSVKGYTNHLLNGITTLEWCKRLEELMDEKNHFEKSIYHFATKDSLTKYELLKLIVKIFHRNITVEPLATPQAIYRLLSSDLPCLPIDQQLKELYEYTQLYFPAF